MRFRIKFVHGLEVVYEAETIEDDGVALTLLNARGEIVIRYMDSDVASCEAMEPAAIETGDTYGHRGGHRLYDAAGGMVAAYRTPKAARQAE